MSDVSRKSRDVCMSIKKAQPEILSRAATKVADYVGEGGFPDLFAKDTVLVPAPRSSRLVPGALWPAERIAENLVKAGLGGEIQPSITRTESVPKAAYARPGERPSFDRHRETMSVSVNLLAPSRIVVVDDVITQGHMLGACVSLLREAYPRADIKAFALVRTMGLVPDVDRIVDPCLGTLTILDGGVSRSDTCT